MKKISKILFIAFSIILAAVSLNACKVVKYTLNFDSNGGSEVDSIHTNGYLAVKMPEDPEWEGRTFEGWYWDNNTFLRPFSADSLIYEPINRDTTVYAKWFHHSYTVSFQGNGGEYISGEQSQTVLHGNSAQAPVYEMEGFTLNWDTEFDNITSDLLVSAVWSVSVYSVTFNGDGATLLSGSVFQNINHGDSALEPEFVKYGFLLSWDKSFDSVTSNLTVNAIWTTAFTYTVLDGDVVLTGLKEEYTLSTLEIPASINDNGIVRAVSGIADFAFVGKDILTLSIADSIIEIGEGAFDNTPWYHSQSNGLVYSGKVVYKLKYKDALAENTVLSIRAGTKGIAKKAFYGSIGLIEIIIPNSVINIGVGAFQNCINLTAVSVPDSVIYIGENAFANTEWFDSQENGVVYAGKVAYKYKGIMPQNTAVILLEGTKGIAARAFENCTGLLNIDLPDGLLSIGKYAFYNCVSLTALDIPSSVAEIGSGAIIYCNSLAAVTVSDHNEKYVSHEGVLYNKDKTVLISCPAGKSGDYIVPSGVTTISSYAFYACTKLTAITLPSSVTSIGQDAFFNCSATLITL